MIVLKKGITSSSVSHPVMSVCFLSQNVSSSVGVKDNRYSLSSLSDHFSTCAQFRTTLGTGIFTFSASVAVLVCDLVFVSGFNSSPRELSRKANLSSPRP